MLELQDAKVRALAKTVGTVWGNQVSLDTSINRVEEEFCVLGRLIIPKMNEMLIAMGSEDLITEEAINGVFLIWHEFQKRPDFKKHFVQWFMGVPLDEMPVLIPEQKEENTIDTPAQEDGGVIAFGGDYGEGQAVDSGNETAEEEQPQSNAGGPEDALPEGQDADDTVRGAEQGEGAEVPQVPDGV